MTASRPPDVDAQARRLPRRELPPERSAALRQALLDAAGAPQARQPRAPARRWVIGAGVVAAAAACAVLALRVVVPAHPEAPPATAASEAALPSAAASAAAAAPPAPGDPLPDGVSAIHATRPLQVVRGDTSITAPPGAQFEVDVQGDRVRLVTVTSGWVVVAGARMAATVVVERQTWFPPAAPDTDPGAAPPAASPRTASPVPVPAGSPSTAPRGGAPAAEPAPPRRRPPVVAASRSPSDGAPAPEAAPPATAAPELSPIDAAAQQAAAAEQAFHDGLQALLAGKLRAAIAALDRACGMPSTSQDDICYWAAVAWLRAGDRGHARQALSDVLTRWPGSTHAGEASVALGWLLLDAGERAAARARFAAAADDRMPGVRAEAARGLAAAQ